MEENHNISLENLTQPEAKALFNEKVKPFMSKLFSDIKAQVVEELATPCTIRELAALTNRSYANIRAIIEEFNENNLLVSTEFQAKKGRAYMMNYPNLLLHIANLEVGKFLLAEVGITVPESAKWKVNQSAIYSEFPTPLGPVLELKLGQENTNIFKMMLAVTKTNTRLDQMYYIAMLGVSHVWYRNFLQTQDTQQDLPIMGPSAKEVRAMIRNLSKQVRDYSKLLDTIAENELVWGDTEHFESFRVLGDLPLQWQRQNSATLVDAWQSGRVNVGGFTGRLQDEYEEVKNHEARKIQAAWAKHQNDIKDVQ